MIEGHVRTFKARSQSLSVKPRRFPVKNGWTGSPLLVCKGRDRAQVKTDDRVDEAAAPGLGGPLGLGLGLGSGQGNRARGRGES